MCLSKKTAVPVFRHRRRLKPDFPVKVWEGDCYRCLASHCPAGLDAPLAGFGAGLTAGHVATLEAGLGTGLTDIRAESTHLW